MTLLEHIERMFEERKGDVFLKHKDERGYLLDGNTTDKYAHRVDFWIVPGKGLYSVVELQSCLDELVSSLPTLECVEQLNKEYFRLMSERIYFGRVMLVEEIGQKEVERLKCYDLDLTSVGACLRKITLKLFPDERYVINVLKGQFQLQYGCFVRYLEQNLQRKGFRGVA